MDIISQSSHEGKEQGSESAKLFPTCRSPESSQGPKQCSKGALHSLMILCHASPTQAAADIPQQGVNAQLLWKGQVTALSLEWEGPSLVQDSLVARPRAMTQEFSRGHSC